MIQSREGAPRHTYSVEVLTHFKCAYCERWWTIADLQIEDGDVLEVACPRCGCFGLVETAGPAKESRHD